MQNKKIKIKPLKSFFMETGKISLKRNLDESPPSPEKKKYSGTQSQSEDSVEEPVGEDGTAEKRSEDSVEGTTLESGTVLHFGKPIPASCEFRKTFLDILNPHPRDENIVFDEVPHKYYIYGVKWDQSTTSWISQFHEEFDADRIAKLMVRSEKFAKCQGEHKKYTAIVNRWRDERLHIDKVVELVKEWWKENGEEASSLGTRMHKQIEEYINEVASQSMVSLEHPDRSTVEFKQFLVYWNDMVDKEKFTPYRTEMKIYAEEYKLCGTVDMVFIDSQGRYRLRDWKRSKKISTFSRDFCKPPFQRFRSCNFIKYSMQLHFYAKILCEHYGIEIYDMAMVIFHPNQKTYTEIFALDLSAEMNVALAQHSRNLV